MTIDELNNQKTPIVVVDNSLEREKGRTLFPEKLAKANEVAARIGAPKITKR